MKYRLPEPYFQIKRVCFDCWQMGCFRPQIVVLQNHKGYLCEACANASPSFNVQSALENYRKQQQGYQPFIGDLAQDILDMFATGYKGRCFDIWHILRQRIGYEHLSEISVSTVLWILAEEGQVSAEIDLSSDAWFFDLQYQRFAKSSRSI